MKICVLNILCNHSHFLFYEYEQEGQMEVKKFNLI